MAVEEVVEPQEQEPQETNPAAQELEALKQRISALDSALAAERARNEERAKAPPAPPPQQPVLTRAQLQDAVDNGHITQQQMEEEIARQMREAIRTDVRRELSSEFDQKRQTEIIREQFDRYMELKPDVKVEGTSDRQRVADEMKELLKLGYPNDLRTEVTAMRAVFGPLERVKETTRQRREVNRETAGGGGERAQSGGTGAKWEKGLTQTQIGIYRSQLDKGIYKGENDPFFIKVTTRARTNNAERKSA